jgi:hypothetical protein
MNPRKVVNNHEPMRYFVTCEVLATAGFHLFL